MRQKAFSDIYVAFFDFFVFSVTEINHLLKTNVHNIKSLLYSRMTKKQSEYYIKVSRPLLRILGNNTEFYGHRLRFYVSCCC